MVDFKEVKAKIPIAQIFEHFKSDLCPSCQGALIVSQEKNVFKCKACGKGGNILDLAAKHKSVSIKEAAEYLHGVFIAPQAPQEETTRPFAVPPGFRLVYLPLLLPNAVANAVDEVSGKTAVVLR